MRKVLIVLMASLLCLPLTACDSGGGSAPPPKGGARRPVEPGARKAPGFDGGQMKQGEEDQAPAGTETKPAEPTGD
jgi:hypothetical protein